MVKLKKQVRVKCLKVKNNNNLFILVINKNAETGSEITGSNCRCYLFRDLSGSIFVENTYIQMHTFYTYLYIYVFLRYVHFLYGTFKHFVVLLFLALAFHAISSFK